MAVRASAEVEVTDRKVPSLVQCIPRQQTTHGHGAQGQKSTDARWNLLPSCVAVSVYVYAMRGLHSSLEVATRCSSESGARPSGSHLRAIASSIGKNPSVCPSIDRLTGARQSRAVAVVASIVPGGRATDSAQSRQCIGVSAMATRRTRNLVLVGVTPVQLTLRHSRCNCLQSQNKLQRQSQHNKNYDGLFHVLHARRVMECRRCQRILRDLKNASRKSIVILIMSSDVSSEQISLDYRCRKFNEVCLVLHEAYTCKFAAMLAWQRWANDAAHQRKMRAFTNVGMVPSG